MGSNDESLALGLIDHYRRAVQDGFFIQTLLTGSHADALSALHAGQPSMGSLLIKQQRPAALQHTTSSLVRSYDLGRRCPRRCSPDSAYIGGDGEGPSVGWTWIPPAAGRESTEETRSG